MTTTTPRVSRLAIASLSVVIITPLAALLELILEIPLQAALALPALLGVILAHVAYFRIRRRNTELTGFGFTAAAMAIGYLSLVLCAVLYVLFFFVMESLGRWSHT